MTRNKLLLSMFFALTQASLAYAQTDPAAERAAAFRAVQGPEAESIAGGPLLIAAYVIVWLAVFLYVLRLGRIARRNTAELTRLTESLKSERD